MDNWINAKKKHKAGVWKREETPLQMKLFFFPPFFIILVFDLTSNMKVEGGGASLVREEASEGLPEATDGLGLGLVVGQASP